MLHVITNSTYERDRCTRKIGKNILICNNESIPSDVAAQWPEGCGDKIKAVTDRKPNRCALSMQSLPPRKRREGGRGSTINKANWHGNTGPARHASTCKHLQGKNNRLLIIA